MNVFRVEFNGAVQYFTATVRRSAESLRNECARHYPRAQDIRVVPEPTMTLADKDRCNAAIVGGIGGE
jgi:hypothetical protein